MASDYHQTPLKEKLENAFHQKLSCSFSSFFPPLFNSSLGKGKRMNWAFLGKSEKKCDEIQGNPVTFGWKKCSTSYRVLPPAKHLTLKDQARLSMRGTDWVLIQEFQLYIGTHPFSFFKTKCRRKALVEPGCLVASVPWQHWEAGNAGEPKGRSLGNCSGGRGVRPWLVVGSQNNLFVFGCGCQDEINLAWAVKVWIYLC